jgi:hypothetical protein
MTVQALPVAVDRLVPLLWPGRTVVCLASGPSLTAADVQFVCGRAPVIAINAAIQVAPWADVFYSGARDYWTPAAVASRRAAGFHGLSVRLALNQGMGPHQERPGILPDGSIVLGNTGDEGLELQPIGLRTFKNSGGAAINLAVHFGARRVVLLGYDMAPDRHGRHHFTAAAGQAERHFSPYPAFRTYLGTMVGPLRAAGVDVLNCSRSTTLEHFRRVPLEAVPW